MRQPRCLGLEGLEIIIKRKTALSAGDAWYFSECQLGPSAGVHTFHHYERGANVPNDIST